LLIELTTAIAVRDPTLPNLLQAALLSGVSPEQITVLITYVSTRAGDPKVALHATSAGLHLATPGPEGASESTVHPGAH